MSSTPSSLLLCCLLCWRLSEASDPETLPTAVNITWTSVNFKTILEWQPKPANFVYTVEIAGKKSDWKKKCIYTEDTECDVTDQLQDATDTYQARILSLLRVNDDIPDEPPFAISPPFIPYQQTIIGKPKVESYQYNDGKTKLKVLIEDPLTPYLLPNGRFKSIREFFKNDLRYIIYYWRASSTGKKHSNTTTNEVEISVDRGESYCFYIQATVPSRKENRESQKSETQCISYDGRPLNEYGIGVFVAAIIAVVLIIGIIIALSVTLYKCKKGKKEVSEKEHMPLNDV